MRSSASVQQPGSPVLDALAERFGARDHHAPTARSTVRRWPTKVFADPEAVKALNKIVHPAVGRRDGAAGAGRGRPPIASSCSTSRCWRRAARQPAGQDRRRRARSRCRSSGWCASAASTRPTPGRASPGRRPASNGWSGANFVVDNSGAPDELAPQVDERVDRRCWRCPSCRRTSTSLRRTRGRLQREAGERLVADHLAGRHEAVALGRSGAGEPSPGTQPTRSPGAAQAPAWSMTRSQRQLADAPALVAAVDHQPPQERVGRASAVGSATMTKPTSSPSASTARYHGTRRPPASSTLGAPRPRRARRRWGRRGARCQPNVVSRPTGAHVRRGDLDEADRRRGARSGGRATPARSLAQQAEAGVVEPLATDQLGLPGHALGDEAEALQQADRRQVLRVDGGPDPVDLRTSARRRGRRARRPPRPA